MRKLLFVFMIAFATVAMYSCGNQEADDAEVNGDSLEMVDEAEVTPDAPAEEEGVEVEATEEGVEVDAENTEAEISEDKISIKTKKGDLRVTKDGEAKVETK